MNIKIFSSTFPNWTRKLGLAKTIQNAHLTIDIEDFSGEWRLFDYILFRLVIFLAMESNVEALITGGQGQKS